MAYSYRNLGSNGRLGNQLFQIAGTLGKARADGSQAHFPHWVYAPYFSVPENLFGNIPLDATDLGRDYLQDISLFAESVVTIQEYFTFSNFAQQNLLEIFPQWIHHDAAHRTAVHIRRGDYLTFGAHFSLCPIHYFESAMDEMRREFPDTQFLIFTDDPDWCHGYFHGRSDAHIVSEKVENTLQREMAEFALMTSCDSFIISNSTFSWWSAFLSQSENVVVPNKWYNEALAHLDASKFLLPHWKQRSIAPIGPYKPHHVTVVESSTGLIATNHQTRAVHHMNSTAALFFELCTGSNPHQRIIELMTSLLAKHGVQWTGADAELTLADLVARGLTATEDVEEPI